MPFQNTEYAPVENFAPIKRGHKLEVGQKLALVARSKDNGEHGIVEVEVLPFEKCQAAFDPKNRFILDKNEQICTTVSEHDWGFKDGEISTGLLFTYPSSVDDPFGHLVGIQSMVKKNKDGECKLFTNEILLLTMESLSDIGVSTFVPYHCDFFKESLSQEVCV